MEDFDKNKYLQLGRMVNEVGFDWVYYVIRGYIYVFVKIGR